MCGRLYDAKSLTTGTNYDFLLRGSMHCMITCKVDWHKFIEI